ncbi:MAG: ArnT family glycosyltransferase [Nitrososphaerota archaeon]
MPHKIVASPGNASSGKHIDEIDTMKMPVTTAIANGNRRRASSTIPLDETVSDPGLSLPSQTRRRLHFHVLDLAFIGALALGSFLRLFRIDTAPFWNDSAGTFTLAHEVLTLGALPITGIHSSIGSFTPPGAVYVYLLPSLLGSPTLGAIETALANIAAIVLIYYVCRLYLNPVIGFLTALLFSISAGPVTFSRFIWQPNMQVPFTVLLIALVLAGVIGKRRGWLMWALPVLGLAIQMHPVTGALLGLIIIGWLLAPETVRIRDLVIGSILTLALFVPTIVFEVMSKFFDLKVYEALAHKPSVISASVFHRFLQIDELTWVPGWGNTRIYHALNVAWEALLVVGLCYVALRVIAPFLMAARRSLAAGGWRRGIPYILGWMRDDRRARWRIDLIVLLWPSLILAAQIRHNSFVNIHYVIGIFPAQFLATAFFLYDVGAVIPRLRLGVRVPAIGIVAMCGVLLAAVCITQPTGIITSYFGDQPRSLASEQADLAQAQSLAMQYHVSLVVFQTDYQSREPTRYLLQTRYPFAAPTQIMASGACLAGAPAGGDSVLYLMSGNKSLWEAFITQIPGVHDLLSESRPVGFFRAYVVTADELASQLKPFGASVTPASVTFGDTIAADHLWQIPVAGQSASALAVEAHMLNAPSSPEFERLYDLSATISGSEGQAAVSGSTACNVAPWMPQQKVYYMLRQVTTDDITPGATLTLSASDVTYNDGNLRLGSLRLITAYDLSTAEYLTAPVARQTFPVNGCGQAEVTCTDATTAVIKLG